MTPWYVIEEAYGEAERLDRTFKTYRDAAFYVQCTHDTVKRPSRNWAGNYELCGDVITNSPREFAT
jgi:hypothetical protein